MCFVSGYDLKRRAVIILMSFFFFPSVCLAHIILKLQIYNWAITTSIQASKPDRPGFKCQVSQSIALILNS